MRKYFEPNTTVLNIEAQALICAGSPTGNGDDPANARAPQRRISGLYI